MPALCQVLSGKRHNEQRGHIWASRFQVSRRNIGPRATGCSRTRSSCGAPWRPWRLRGAELPPGGLVPEDYVFTGAGAGGGERELRLSELFEPGKDSLAIYSFMFPRDPGDKRPGPASGESASLALEDGPCPSCVALLDQLDGAANHVTQHVNLAVVAKAPLAHLLTFARERGWRALRLLSSANNTYNRDYHGETAGGDQLPMLNVFHRDGEVVR